MPWVYFFGILLNNKYRVFLAERSQLGRKKKTRGRSLPSVTIMKKKYFSSGTKDGKNIAILGLFIFSKTLKCCSLHTGINSACAFLCSQQYRDYQMMKLCFKRIDLFPHMFNAWFWELGNYVLSYDRQIIWHDSLSLSFNIDSITEKNCKLLLVDQ